MRFTASRDAFVAGFIGENNALDGWSTRRRRAVCVALPGGLQLMATAVGAMHPGARVIVAVRPEGIHLGDNGGPRTTAASAGDDRIYLGDHQRLLVEIENGSLSR